MGDSRRGAELGERGQLQRRKGQRAGRTSRGEPAEGRVDASRSCVTAASGRGSGGGVRRAGPVRGRQEPRAARLPGGLGAARRGGPGSGGVGRGPGRGRAAPRAAARTLAGRPPRRHQLPTTLRIARHHGKPGAAGGGGTSASALWAGSAAQPVAMGTRLWRCGGARSAQTLKPASGPHGQLWGRTPGPRRVAPPRPAVPRRRCALDRVSQLIVRRGPPGPGELGTADRP